MISVLLGLVDRPVFEILYRSAYRTCIYLEPSISLRPFTKKFIHLSKAEKLKIEPVNLNENLFLVESLAWLVVISPDQDLNTVRTEFLSRLLYVNDVMGAFVVVCGMPPRWMWVQVSKGARIKAQACRQKETA
jgi:hypothetical protein